MEAVSFLPQSAEKRLILRLLHACIREKILLSTLNDNLLFIPLKHSHKTIIVNKVQQYELEKYKFNGEIILITNNQISVMNEVSHFLHLVHGEIKNIVGTNGKNLFLKLIIVW